MSKDKKDSGPRPIGDVVAKLTEPSSEPPAPIKCKVCEREFEWLFGFGKWRAPFRGGDNICDECRELADSKAVEERKKREVEQERGLREKHIEELMLKVGVPSAYLTKTFENYESLDQARQKLLSTASDYARALIGGEFKNEFGLFMGGARGVGKTHLACAVMREAVLAGIKSRFENFPRALLKIKSTFSKRGNGPDESELIARTARVPFLIIDDLGKETLSSWARTTAYLIINEREFEALPFIITSNLFLDEIARDYDDAIASRIDGTCRVLELDRKTPDFRGRSKRGK